MLLEEAGLGEKLIKVPDIDCSAEAFRDVLLATFPKLQGGGGYELLRCLPNSRELVVLGPKVSNCPRLLKRRVGNGRVYVRPIQRELSLDLEEESGGEVDAGVSTVSVE